MISEWSLEKRNIQEESKVGEEEQKNERGRGVENKPYVE